MARGDEMETEYFSFRLRLLVTGTWVKICYKILKSHWNLLYDYSFA